jgi:hypothetical protein
MVWIASGDASLRLLLGESSVVIFAVCDCLVVSAVATEG